MATMVAGGPVLESLHSEMEEWGDINFRNFKQKQRNKWC